MMTKLRERTAIILWIVIFAFVGLIVVEWGADYSGSGSNPAGDAVGVVNGEKITLKQFQQALRFAAQRQRAAGEASDQDGLVRELWDEFVRDILVSQEIERLGIEITDKELALVTRTQPPPAVQTMEVFQTEGVFDPVKYNQFLSDPTTYSDPRNKFFVMQVEDIVRQQWLNYRLQSFLKETVQVSPAELREYFEDRNELVEVEYLFVPSSSIPDGEVTLSEGDLEAYFQENAEDYRHPEQIRIEFVAYPKTASAEDSALVAEEIKTLRKEILAGADFEALAKSVSEDEGSAVNGGDLGVFGRGRMVQAFEQVAFELEPGQVSDPVMSPFGWHLIKAEERLEEEGKEQIRARHILLKIGPSRQTQESLSEKAEEFREVAENLGFLEAVGVTGMQVRDSGYLQEGQAVPSLGPDTAWLVNQFFEGEVGTVSQVLQNERFFWVAHLSERREEGVAALEEVRQQAERMARLEKKAEICSRRLEGVRQQVLSSRTLDQAAAEENLEVRRPEPFARSESVPNVGRRNAFVGAAFRLEPGELSEVVTLPRGAYLLRSVDKVAADEDQFQAEREQLAQQLLIERQNEVLQTWFTQIFQSADIQDNRHRFFTF